MGEKPQPDEVQKAGFFDRPSGEVVRELSEKIFNPSQTPKQYEVVPQKNRKQLVVKTNEGVKTYDILLAEPFSAANPNQVWKKKRLDEIRSLEPGSTVAYGSRSGVMSFIVTKGGDNIMLKTLRDTDTGEIIPNATAVSRILGLSHGQRGRLNYDGGKTLHYQKAA